MSSQKCLVFARSACLAVCQCLSLSRSLRVVATSLGRPLELEHSHHLFGLHVPDGVFQRDELNEGKSSAGTYMGWRPQQTGVNTGLAMNG